MSATDSSIIGALEESAIKDIIKIAQDYEYGFVRTKDDYEHKNYESVFIMYCGD